MSGRLATTGHRDEPEPAGASRVAGLLVAVEGIDGAGKSTLVRGLAGRLAREGVAVQVVTRYMVPAFTALWQRLVAEDAVDQQTAAALAVADIYLGLGQIIEPALDRGMVIADRYVASHLVHFALRGVALPWLQAAFALARPPDLILYLDLPVDLALSRLGAQHKPDLWECGLDYRWGLSIGAAARRYQQARPPEDELAGHFRCYQGQAQQLFAAVLPEARTAYLDASERADRLAAQAWRLVGDRVARPAAPAGASPWA